MAKAKTTKPVKAIEPKVKAVKPKPVITEAVAIEPVTETVVAPLPEPVPVERSRPFLLTDELVDYIYNCVHDGIDIDTNRVHHTLLKINAKN